MVGADCFGRQALLFQARWNSAVERVECDGLMDRTLDHGKCIPDDPLTDAIDALNKTQRVFAREFKGKVLQKYPEKVDFIILFVK